MKLFDLNQGQIEIDGGINYMQLTSHLYIISKLYIFFFPENSIVLLIDHEQHEQQHLSDSIQGTDYIATQIKGF